MKRISLIFIFLVLFLPCFFLYMTTNHPNYYGQYEESSYLITMKNFMRLN